MSQTAAPWYNKSPVDRFGCQGFSSGPTESRLITQFRCADAALRTALITSEWTTVDGRPSCQLPTVFRIEPNGKVRAGSSFGAPCKPEGFCLSDTEEGRDRPEMVLVCVPTAYNGRRQVAGPRRRNTAQELLKQRGCQNAITAETVRAPVP